MIRRFPKFRKRRRVAALRYPKCAADTTSRILDQQGPGGSAVERRTRIVATLGPASEPPAVLEALLRAGVDVVRINFSHGEPGEHMRRIAAVRDATRRCGRVVAVLADL